MQRSVAYFQNSDLINRAILVWGHWQNMEALFGSHGMGKSLVLLLYTLGRGPCNENATRVVNTPS